VIDRSTSRTQFETLSALIDRAVTVRDLVDSPLFVVSSSLRASEARELMLARAFDVVGVDTTGDGRADSFVHIKELDGHLPLYKAATPLMATETVEKSMPLGGLLQCLKQRERVFVLDGDHVRFILTRADVARPTVGVVVLAHLLALEQALLTLALPRIGSRWLDALPRDRATNVVKLYDQKRRRKAELGLEDCLLFSDVMELTLKAPGLLSSLGLTQGKFAKLRPKVEHLRNDLAHGGTITDRLTAMEALAVFDEVRVVVERSSVLAAELDDLWQAYANTWIVRDDGNGQLVGPEATGPLPLPPPVHVITAWNPDSSTRPDAGNRRAQHQLLHRVHQAGLASLKVAGQSPDGVWTEPSIAVSGLTREEAVRWGKEFGQKAIFEVDEFEVHVVPCESGRARSRQSRRLANDGAKRRSG
jgi:hypothetical protein